MFWKQKTERPTPPAHFPRDFLQIWGDLEDPQSVRMEVAALLLADLRTTGPNWSSDRYACLAGLLNDLESAK